MSVNVYDPVNDRLIPVAGATLFADAPVGSIIAFAGKEINLPEGYLAFNGQTVKRGDYPDLWAFAVANEQVGVDKFFSQGDGSTTFTLADLRETSLKGYGETSRSVGAHVKSGGLGIGEFIDDRLQDHEHSLNEAYNSELSSIRSVVMRNRDIQILRSPEQNISSGRHGTTTEVKAVGVVWAVKARMTGLPIDLKEQVEDEVFSMLDHRNIFRGRCLNGDKNTLYPTTPFPGAPTYPGLGYTIKEVFNMIADGSFSDVWTGDYFIDTNDSNRVYRIADLDAYMKRGYPTKVDKHHAVIVPDYSMASAQWNTTNTTSGGYPSSNIKAVMEGPSVLGKINTFFGSSRIIGFNPLEPQGDATWGWASALRYISPMSEAEIYGSSIFGNGYQSGTACTLLALFELMPELAVGLEYNFWLISISSSSDACSVDDRGIASYDGASSSLGCRPRFLFGGEPELN